MIIVAGTITIDPEQFGLYQAAAEPMIAATLEEEGCHTYNFAQSVIDPSEVRIFEVWDSMSHLEAHFVAPHMATFQAALADLSITGRNITVYESEAVRTL